MIFTHCIFNSSQTSHRACKCAVIDFSAALLASGQNTAVAGLLLAMGGSAFVLADTAETLVAQGRFKMVTDVEPIGQPIFAVMHQRHRTSRMHRRLTRIVAREISGRGVAEREQSRAPNSAEGLAIARSEAGTPAHGTTAPT